LHAALLTCACARASVALGRQHPAGEQPSAPAALHAHACPSGRVQAHVSVRLTRQVARPQALIYVNPWGVNVSPEGATITPALIAIAPTAVSVGQVGKEVQTVGIAVPPP